MKSAVSNERIEFLAKKFNVFEQDDLEEIINSNLENGLTDDMLKSKCLTYVLAVRFSEKVDNETLVFNPIVSFGISLEVFSRVIASDPTPNKIFVQWMLGVIASYLKTKSGMSHAFRFIEEDLPSANEYLALFEQNKRKKRFTEFCHSSANLKHIKDCTNINQYANLSELFDAVDPFIEKNPSNMERSMEKFVSMGMAEIPYKDRRYTVYVPLSLPASVIFNSFASWCTARTGNSNFVSYTRGHENTRPDGKPSKLYILIDNKFYKSDNGDGDIWQLHFETNQLFSKKNSDAKIKIKEVIDSNEGLRSYFKEELVNLAKCSGGRNSKDKYLEYLFYFDFIDSIFELIEKDTPRICLEDKNIKWLPDLSEFKNLENLIIVNGGLEQLHTSIGSMTRLEVLCLPNNKIKVLPKEISSLKNMNLFNIKGNKLESIPEEIKYLDTTQGGSLSFLGVDQKDVGLENYKRLRCLLPSVTFL